MKLEGILSGNETSFNKSKTGKEKLNKAQEAMERLRAEAENLKKSNLTGCKCFNVIL